MIKRETGTEDYHTCTEMTLVLCLEAQLVRTWARRDSTCIKKNITLFWHLALSDLAIDECNHCPVPAVSLGFWWWQSAASLYTSKRGFHVELCDLFFLASNFPPRKMKVMERKSFSLLKIHFLFPNIPECHLLAPPRHTHSSSAPSCTVPKGCTVLSLWT